MSAAGAANTLTITLDALAGAAYDEVLLSQDMTAVINLNWTPVRPREYANGDAIVVAWTNGSSRTYGLKIRYKMT